jgi:hypothetical protein
MPRSPGDKALSAARRHAPPHDQRASPVTVALRANLSACALPLAPDRSGTRRRRIHFSKKWQLCELRPNDARHRFTPFLSQTLWVDFTATGSSGARQTASHCAHIQVFISFHERHRVHRKCSRLPEAVPQAGTTRSRVPVGPSATRARTIRLETDDLHRCRRARDSHMG